MTAQEKIAAVRAQMAADGWAMEDRGNPYSVTGVHFDGYPVPVSVHVFSDMQGRLSVSLNAHGGVTMNERFWRLFAELERVR